MQRYLCNGIGMYTLVYKNSENCFTVYAAMLLYFFFLLFSSSSNPQDKCAGERKKERERRKSQSGLLETLNANDRRTLL